MCVCVLCADSFGTHTAKHTFCRVCGVLPFYTPRSNPDGYAVTVHCVDAGTIARVVVERYDGRNWEAQFEAMPDLAARSKGE